MIKKHDFSLDRYSVRRRSTYYRKVTRTEKRKLESSRNRSCRKGESIHRSLQLTELLLCTYTELLLLVYNEKSEILELETLSNKLVSTYHNVESSRLQSLLNVRYFLSSPQSAHIIDIAWKILQTVLECIEMLEGKNSGRHKHSHLLAVRHSLESRTDSNLGLSETYITTDESVHRTIVLHIPFNGMNSLLLIRSILIHK